MTDSIEKGTKKPAEPPSNRGPGGRRAGGTRSRQNSLFPSIFLLNLQLFFLPPQTARSMRRLINSAAHGAVKKATKSQRPAWTTSPDVVAADSPAAFTTMPAKAEPS